MWMHQVTSSVQLSPQSEEKLILLYQMHVDPSRFMLFTCICRLSMKNFMQSSACFFAEVSCLEGLVPAMHQSHLAQVLE